MGWASYRRWPPTSLRDSPDHLNIGASCCWVDGGVPCWVEVRRAPCWPPSPGLVRALDDVVRPFPHPPLLGGGGEQHGGGGGEQLPGEQRQGRSLAATMARVQALPDTQGIG